MNEAMATRLLDEVDRGRRVVVVNDNMIELREAFRQISNGLRRGMLLWAANGGEGISQPGTGGEIRFTTLPGCGAMRGVTADLVVFDEFLPTREQQLEARAVALPGGEILVSL